MISLIIATLGRVDELERLLVSLDAQNYKQFEVLLVDQNEDDRLIPIVQQHPQLAVRRLRSPRGAARARNTGLKVACGAIVGFPDDDCWYPPTVLSSIVQWLDEHPEVDGISGTMRDDRGQAVGPRWLPEPADVSKENLWRTTIAVTAFLRRRVTDSVGFFREDIGVGAPTRYQSGEESDYFLRALALGFRMRYDPSFVVHHPNLHSIERLREKTYPYALGAGYVLRIHGYSWVDFAEYVVRSVGGAVVSLGKGDVSMSQVYLLRAAGQLRGYFWGPRDLARYHAQSH
jgi:glycosyltransferase involved in cell wall biosynthesis